MTVVCSVEMTPFQLAPLFADDTALVAPDWGKPSLHGRIVWCLGGADKCYKFRDHAHPEEGSGWVYTHYTPIILLDNVFFKLIRGEIKIVLIGATRTSKWILHFFDTMQTCKNLILKCMIAKKILYYLYFIMRTMAACVLDSQFSLLECHAMWYLPED
jgi:hypothetical protein